MLISDDDDIFADRSGGTAVPPNYLDEGVIIIDTSRMENPDVGANVELDHTYALRRTDGVESMSKIK